MNYYAKYNNMTTALNNLSSTASSLNDNIQRLNAVRLRLGLFTSLMGYGGSVNARANAAGHLRTLTLKTWKCLDEARTVYYTHEQKAYQLISGDRSFNIGDGLPPVSVPLSGLSTRFPWFELSWNFSFSMEINIGKGEPLVPWPMIPWWSFVYLRMHFQLQFGTGTDNTGENLFQNDRIRWIDTPGSPGTPGTPGTPDTPDTPGTQGTPGTPYSPYSPGTPGTPITPVTPVSGLVPYTGTYDYSNFSVVSGFSEAYCYRQLDYKRFVNSSGRNVGCTATAEAIVASIAKGRTVSPNEVGWGPGGATWQHSHVIEGSRSLPAAQKLQVLANQLSQGNPVIVRANSNHTVAAVGIKNGADLSNISASDILIVDPASGKITTLDKASSGGCTLPNTWSLMVAN